MKMCLVMILVKKVFIFSKTLIICLLCPLLCGLFFFWKGAKGELSYKVKKRMLSISILVMLRFRWYFCISYYFYWFYYMQTMIGCQDWCYYFRKKLLIYPFFQDPLIAILLLASKCIFSPSNLYL